MLCFDMQVLGIIGALDPHTHKVNLAELQGEGRLEREGVRPQFPNKQPQELGACMRFSPVGLQAGHLATAQQGFGQLGIRHPEKPACA